MQPSIILAIRRTVSAWQPRKLWLTGLKLICLERGATKSGSNKPHSDTANEKFNCGKNNTFPDSNARVATVCRLASGAGCHEDTKDKFE